jgi:hypothetical protein
MINFLKEESGGSLANDWNLVRVGASVGTCAQSIFFVMMSPLVLSGCCNVGSLEETKLLGFLEFLRGRVSPRCKGHPISWHRMIVH